MPSKINLFIIVSNNITQFFRHYNWIHRRKLNYPLTEPLSACMYFIFNNGSRCQPLYSVPKVPDDLRWALVPLVKQWIITYIGFMESFQATVCVVTKCEIQVFQRKVVKRVCCDHEKMRSIKHHAEQRIYYVSIDQLQMYNKSLCFSLDILLTNFL